MSKNVILIGMPSSDKVAIGKNLSKRLGLKFINIDENIVDNSDKSILVETQSRESIEKLVKSKSSVICAGIDVIEDGSNIKELRENGVIVFIDKSVEKIIEDEKQLNNKSLLKDEVCKLHEHFSEKYESYRKCCDLHLVNNNNIDEIVQYISSICS